MGPYQVLRPGNKDVLHIPQNSSINGTSQSDCLMSYPGHSLYGWGFNLYAEMQYSTVPATWRSHQLQLRSRWPSIHPQPAHLPQRDKGYVYYSLPVALLQKESRWNPNNVLHSPTVGLPLMQKRLPGAETKYLSGCYFPRKTILKDRKLLSI